MRYPGLAKASTRPVVAGPDGRDPQRKKPLIATRPRVTVSLPRGELFVGSFHRLVVEHPSTAG